MVNRWIDSMKLFSKIQIVAHALSVFFGVVLVSVIIAFPSYANPENAENTEANNQLIRAAQENNLQKMKEALKKGADINTRTESGQTVLHFVKNPVLAKFIIEKGADVNRKDYDFEMTPIYFHEVAIARLLYKAGADIHIKAKKGITPLMWYTYSNYLDGVKFLITNGAHINTINGEGSTAMDIALRFEYAELARYLKSVGAKTAAELHE